MDEDIDIEEHDVLDNPKIRDIFPDLSLVKIEPPDVNEQDCQYGQPPLYESRVDVMTRNIKREAVSDDDNDYTSEYHHNESDHNYVQRANNFDQSGQRATYENEQRARYEDGQRPLYEDEQIAIYGKEQNDNTHCNYEQSEQNICDYEQNDIEISSNRIILGSKPTFDYDELYEEALNSKSTVYLENWDPKLKSSPCYCHSCEILYPTINCLDAHKSVSHSLLVALDTPRKLNSPTRNTARKSTVTSTYCDHCKKTFPSETELIKHLYRLLPKNDYKIPTPIPVKIEATSVQYKCIKCKLCFANIEDGKNHKIINHPDCKNINIIFKVQKVSNSKTSEKVNQSSQQNGRMLTNTSLVPKGVLFQCNKCLVNFLSYYSASQHSRRCEKVGDFRKCNICKRKIRYDHFKAHEIQHLHNDKLKIYTLNKNLAERIIAKCPKCNVCYDERGFWFHLAMCNGKKIDFLHCDVCSVDIKETKYPKHRLKHTINKYTQKDFIIIEFYDVNLLPEKSESKMTLYYCDICGSYKTLRSQKGHSNGACQNLRIKFCDICGLGFGRMHYKIHRSTHERLQINNVNDFEIISLHSGKKIKPPMPEFHQCNECQIHFLFKQEVTNHSCEGEKFMTCKICNEKFNLRAFAPHSKFHDFKAHSFKDDMPELLKMYNSINNMWDIVYMCLNCSIITVTYDSAVEHSQSHICGIENSTKTCEICNFDIINKDYMTHVNLHENNSAINREQFRILKFNFKDMYKKKWMNIFAPLPIKDKHQILAKSIYRCTRRFKLNCELYCRTDDTKIYCKKCKTSVSIEEMKKHYFDGQCKYVSNYECKMCKLDFKSLLDCVSHENEHENLNKTYKIYSFNDKNDKEFNKKLLSFDSTKNNKIAPRVLASKGGVKKFVRKPLIKMAGDKNKMADSKGKFKLYKCRKCEACVCLDKNISIHKCTSMKKGVCHICKNAFYPRNLGRHIEMHALYGKKPTIVYFDPASDAGIQKAIIYKCDCGLHFTSKQSIENHLSVCNDDIEISKETCSKCHRLFPTDVLVTHLCKHHSKPVKFHVITIPKKGNFKCGFCNVIFFNMVNFDNHLFQCPFRSGKICKECLLAYDSISFAEHTCDSNQTFVVVKKSVSTSVLYKCKQCNLHYFTAKSLKYHFEQDHNSHRRFVACRICGLRFTEQCIGKHMLIHESGKKQYMIKVIDDTENAHIIKGDNKNINQITTENNPDDNETYNETDSAVNSNIKVEKVIKVIQSSIKKETDIEENISNDSSVNYGILYRCNSCDLCYHFKKTWNYHIEMKHVNKRPVAQCEICGLKFTKNSLINHAPIHQNGDKYVIKIYEMDTDDTTVFKGKNVKSTKQEDKKRPAEVIESPRIKTRKFENTIDNLEASTSKMDFESINMTNNEDKTMKNDSNESSVELGNITDPLVESEMNISNDVDNSLNASDYVLSEKMKCILQNNIKNYSNYVYKCTHCDVCFLTQMACVSHFKRIDDTKKLNFIQCDECGWMFSVQTIARHKYIHHDEMKLTAESLYILSVSEEYNTHKKITDLLIKAITHDTGRDDENKAMDIDEKTLNNSKEIENNLISDVNTDEVNMDVDENVVKDIEIHTYQETNWNTEKQITDASDTKDENADINMDADENKQIESKIHYYKCAECNVCFIKEELCKTHCTSHKKLDPRMFIECKMCSFQFSLDSLMDHVTLHHDTEFILEDLAITEYSPSIDGKIKIDTYRGIDKLQSKLISTTTDVSDVKSMTTVTVENNR